jgi:hypothetical protein
MKITIKIKEEFQEHAEDMVNDGILTLENRDAWHFHLFNEDYYIIGYYESSQWLKNHGFGEIEAASHCVEYEMENFGECHTVYNNTEVVANMVAYILGEQWLHKQGEAFILELLAH